MCWKKDLYRITQNWIEAARAWLDESLFESLKALLVVFGTSIRVPLRYHLFLNEDYLYFTNKELNLGVLLGEDRMTSDGVRILIVTKGPGFKYISWLTNRYGVQSIQSTEITNFLCGLGSAQELSERVRESNLDILESQFFGSAVSGTCENYIKSLFEKRRRHLIWTEAIFEIRKFKDELQVKYDLLFDSHPTVRSENDN